MNDAPIPEPSFYDAVGGNAFFAQLVDGFYEGIETDEVLRPMYPAGDLSDARRHLQLFLEQYWGGPNTYQLERGHPRLRMRHVDFPVNADARDRWIMHMRNSLSKIDMSENERENELRDQLWTYLVTAAHSLMNS